MAELIDINDEKFWDVLFDEACVEGQQAERIEKELKQIATTEAEIRNKAIEEFAKRAVERLDDMGCEAWERDINEIAEQMKGGANE